MGGHSRLVLVAALAGAPTACTALFPLTGISDGETSGDGATVDVVMPDVGGEGSPGADAKPGAEGSAVETGGPEGGADTAATPETGPEAGSEAGGKDATPDAAPESGALTYVDEVLLDLPSGYWRLDEGTGATTAKDSSGHGVNGTYHGGMKFGATGAIANDPDTAATFDSASSYVDMGQVFQFPGTASCSFEAWAQPTVDTDYHGLLSRNDENGPPSEGYLVYIEPSPNPYYDLERLEPPSSKSILQSNYQATSNVWAHVVVTYDGATMAIYVNGNQEATHPSSFGITGATSNFVVGAQAGGSTAWFHGNLDEVAVYDHVLAPARILAHYHVGIGQPP